MKVVYFRTPAAFRAWLEKHHAKARELWVGYHKKATGRPSVTWPESVDEALCFGWIDGVRRSVDSERYAVRFTPRRAGSRWSLVNLRRVRALTRAGRMRAAGLATFRARNPAKTRTASYEQARRPSLAPADAAQFKKNRAAWEYFQAQPPWYRRTTSWWVVSAKKEETRRRRLARLIADSAAGQRIGALQRKPAGK